MQVLTHLLAKPARRLATFCATALLASASAQAALVTFDELASAGNPAVSSGYAGLSWNTFHVVDGTTIPGSGYSAGLVSGRNVIFNTMGSPASFGRLSGFRLDSAYFTSAWIDGLALDVLGYVDSDSVADYSTRIVLGTHSPLRVNFGWVDVTNVVFTPENAGFGRQFVIDNLSIDGSGAQQAVPEPGSIALSLLGLAVAGLLTQRRLRRR